MVRKLALGCLLATFGIVLGFCALEGTASLVLVVWNALLYQRPTMNAGGEVIYDPDIGWVGKPNAFIPDLYGPGVFLRTNSQGFRHATDVGRTAPNGRVRVICSGDSFTFGYGVSNDDTWCQRLETLDGRLDTVNMAEPGYGIDQAYLWYLRDGARLDHAVQVLAFITSDFLRMPSSYFFGYYVPVLQIRDGSLVVTGTPVPRSSSRWRLLKRRLQVATRGLRAGQLARALSSGRADAASAATTVPAAFDESTWKLAAAVFSHLEEVNRRKGSTLVLVYLPMAQDYASGESDPWREHVRAEADRLGIRFEDLVPPFRTLRREQATAMIIPRGIPGTGHYTVEGNRWVADLLHERLAPLMDAAVRAAPAPAPPPRS